MSDKSNLIALDKALADKFRALKRNEKRATVEIAELAALVRNQHLGIGKREYDADFAKWWKNHGGEEIFGTPSTFTTYAKAGDAVGLFKAQFEKHIDRMPTSKAALIELGELTKDEIARGLENTYERTSVDAPESEWKRPKKPKPLINSSTTGPQLRAWREAWRNPRGKTARDKRSLTLMTIKVHGSLYDFDKGGNHSGSLTKEQVRSWSQKVQEIFTGKDALVLIDSNAEKLCSGHDRRQEQASKGSTEAGGRSD
jgi:hypothetical protein